MSKPLYDTKNYIVRLAADDELVIAEDGNYGSGGGYVVVNKETGQIEHTTMILPQAIYQAQGFSDSITALLNPDKETNALSLVETPSDDIVPH